MERTNHIRSQMTSYYMSTPHQPSTTDYKTTTSIYKQLFIKFFKQACQKVNMKKL